MLPVMVHVQADQPVCHHLHAVDNGIFHKGLQNQGRHHQIAQFFVNLLLDPQPLAEPHGHNIEIGIDAPQLFREMNFLYLGPVHPVIQNGSQRLNHFGNYRISRHPGLPVHHFQGIVEEMGVNLRLQCLDLSVFAGQLLIVCIFKETADLPGHTVKSLFHILKLCIGHFPLHHGSHFSGLHPLGSLHNLPDGHLNVTPEKINAIIYQGHKENHQ